MKLKYSASLALALWLCVVAWVSAMIVAKPTVQRNYVDDDGSAAIAQLQNNINNNRRVLAKLEELRAVDGLRGQGLAVASAPAEASGASPDSGRSGAPVSGHRLSMIVSTGKGRRALVDGQLAAPGTRLADGSLLRAIGDDYVRIEDRNGQTRTVRMPAPFTTATDVTTGGAR